MTTETYSPGEETFNRRRQAFGLVVGPLLALAILFMPSALPPAAQRVGAVLALMIVFWMTEALPLAVTALLGPTLCVILGVATAQVAYAPFADPVIFLFIGSFILAEGMIATASIAGWRSPRSHRHGWVRAGCGSSWPMPASPVSSRCG